MAEMTKNEINEINEQIAKLKVKRAELERKEREQAEAERKERETKCEKDFQEIQEMIAKFNQKYDKEVTLATTYKLGDNWSRFTLLPQFLWGLR